MVVYFVINSHINLSSVPGDEYIVFFRLTDFVIGDVRYRPFIQPRRMILECGSPPLVESRCISLDFLTVGIIMVSFLAFACPDSGKFPVHKWGTYVLALSVQGGCVSVFTTHCVFRLNGIVSFPERGSKYWR